MPDFHRRPPWRLLYPGGGTRQKKSGFPRHGSTTCFCDEGCIPGGAIEVDHLAARAAELWEFGAPAPDCCPDAGGTVVLSYVEGQEDEWTWQSPTFECDEYTTSRWVLSIGAEWTTVSTETPRGTIRYRIKTERFAPTCMNVLELDLTEGSPVCEGISCFICLQPARQLVNCPANLCPEGLPALWRMNAGDLVDEADAWYPADPSEPHCGNAVTWGGEHLLEYAQLASASARPCRWLSQQRADGGWVAAVSCWRMWFNPDGAANDWQESFLPSGFYLAGDEGVALPGGYPPGGASARYFLETGEFDCLGPNTFSLQIEGPVGSALHAASGWRETITLFPAS